MVDHHINESEKLKKVFMILDVFSIHEPVLGVREVAFQLELPISTIGRLMLQLRNVGVLIQEPVTKKYRLGSGVLRWAIVSQAGNNLRELSLPILKELNKSTGETATLSIPKSSQRMVLERVETEHLVRYVVTPGDFMPLHIGASGKIFLAFVSEELRSKILESIGMPAFTSATITDMDTFTQELERIRKQGYAISHGERVANVASVAAPVRNVNGDVVAAINVSGPINRFNDENLEKYSTLVIQATQNLSRALGYIRK